MPIPKTVAVGLGICLALGFDHTVQAQVRLDTVCRPQNTLQQSNAIVIGRLTGNRYIVVVPTVESNTLEVVRQCVSDAFQTRSRFGSYIHAGTFQRRSEAARLARILRALGLDARVEFFR